jgi:hypothetical protein
MQSTELLKGADLLAEAQASEEERHAQDEQQVGQNRAKQRGLDDANLILDECDAVRLVSETEGRR